MPGWKRVPDIDGIVNSKGPQLFFGHLWPVENKVKQRSSCPVEDCLDMAFHIILVVSTDSREAPALALDVTVISPESGCKGMIV